MAFDITNQLDNCTITLNDSVNDIVEVSANSGYEFNTDYALNNYIRWRDTYNAWRYQYPDTVTAKKLTFIAIKQNPDYIENAVMYFRGVSLRPVVTPEPVYTITNNIYEPGTAAQYSINNDVVTITVSGSTNNYRLSNIVVTYTDVNNVSKSVNATISSNYQSATAVLTDALLTEDNNFVVSGNYGLYVNIVNNIDNATVEYSTLSTDVNITINAAANCKFFTIPYAIYRDANNTVQTVYFTLNNDRNVATKTITDANTAYDIELNGICKLFVTVINNIDNTTENYTVENNALIVTTTGEINNYQYIGTPTINFDSVSINGVVNGGVATFTVPNADLSKIYTLNGLYDRVVTVQYSLQNCEVTPLNMSVNRNSIITFNATPNQYFRFETQPYMRLINQTTAAQNVSFVENSLTFDFSTLLDFDDLRQIIINAVAVVDSEITNKYGAINVYKVDIDNLNDFGKIRFVSMPSGSNLKDLDKGIYVNSIKRVFIANIGLCVPNTLMLGNYATNIAVFTPINDIVVCNFGNVEIPFINDNLSDFSNNLQIFLPFYGFYNLDSKFVGKTINVTYKCNIISGAAVVLISCNGVLYDAIECNVASNIIYRTTDNLDTKTVGTIDENVNILKGVEPYVNVTYNETINENIINNDSKRCTLGTIEDYAEITELTDFDCSNISDAVYDLIVKTLQNGVYF